MDRVYEDGFHSADPPPIRSTPTSEEGPVTSSRNTQSWVSTTAGEGHSRHSAVWRTIEIGTDPEELHLVREARDGREFGPTAQAERHFAALNGSRQFFVRFHSGGVTSGEDYAYASYLRSEGTPAILQDGSLLWEPALRIRVR